MTYQELSKTIFDGLSEAIANCGKATELNYAHKLGENAEYRISIHQGSDKTYTLTANVYKFENGFAICEPFNGYAVRVSEKARKSNKALLIALDNVLYNRCRVETGIEKSLTKNNVKL
jgi:hypothetical protein